MSNKEKIFCPKCKKRMFDLRLKGSAAIEIKCTHCGSIVTITKETEMRAAQ